MKSRTTLLKLFDLKEVSETSYTDCEKITINKKLKKEDEQEEEEEEEEEVHKICFVILDL